MDVLSMRTALALASAAFLLLGCRRQPEPKPVPCGPSGGVLLSGSPVQARGSAREPAPAAAPCVVHLHGKSGTGAPATDFAGLRHVCPGGNADGWGGRQWLYFPEARYREVREAVRAAIEKSACDRVIVHGFSNGAAAAAKLYCRAESFGHKVVGYLIDDPVTDHGADGCKPDPAFKVQLYWTGALNRARKGWSCASEDWTCEGEETIGVADYARALGTAMQRSPHTTHRPLESPPEYELWLQRADGGPAR